MDNTAPVTSFSNSDFLGVNGNGTTANANNANKGTDSAVEMPRSTSSTSLASSIFSQSTSASATTAPSSIRSGSIDSRSASAKTTSPSGSKKVSSSADLLYDTKKKHRALKL
ncbi:hypothetical protein HDU76_000934, partial [Blyttiomyces sp. JEL0837]